LLVGKGERACRTYRGEGQKKPCHNSRVLTANVSQKGGKVVGTKQLWSGQGGSLGRCSHDLGAKVPRRLGYLRKRGKRSPLKNLKYPLFWMSPETRQLDMGGQRKKEKGRRTGNEKGYYVNVPSMKTERAKNRWGTSRLNMKVLGPTALTIGLVGSGGTIV